MIDGKRATGKSCDFDAYALDASRSVVFASYTNNPDFTEEIFDWLTDVLAAYIDAAPATAQSAQSDAGNTAIETQSDDQAGAPAVDEKTERRLAIVRGWPEAKANGMIRADYAALHSIDASTLTKWKNALRRRGFDVPNF